MSESPRIATRADEQDIAVIHRFLCDESTWARGIPIDVVRRSIANSLNFGLILAAGQVAYARVVSDCATFATLVEVFVLPAYRGRGYGALLMELVLSDARLHGLRRFLLATSTAHGLYAKYGFTAPAKPQALMERLVPDVYRGVQP